MKNILKIIFDAIKIAIDFDEIDVLTETNTVEILSDNDNKILTDSKGNIYTL